MAASPSPTIVLVAHGTVEDERDLPAFLSEIRRGRPTPPELLAEMRHRYRAVGGSPLLEETKKQAAALGAALGLPTRVAMRLWNPRIPQVLGDLGPTDHVCLVPMAPFSVQVYEDAARRSLAERGDIPELVTIAPFGSRPELISAWTETILAQLPADHSATEVILTAHSLPQQVIDAGDPYASQFEAAARQVAAGLPVPTSLAYQSQGALAGRWLGPALEEKIRDAAERGLSCLVVAPIGFLTEHIETLYDLDIEARAFTERLGLTLVRVPALGAHPGLIAALRGAVEERLGGVGLKLPGAARPASS